MWKKCLASRLETRRRRPGRERTARRAGMAAKSGFHTRFLSMSWLSGQAAEMARSSVGSLGTAKAPLITGLP
eukprot:3477305-Lingulodinium_polyedra.AAC.1